MKHDYSRRSLIRIFSGAASALAIGRLGGMSALAQSGPDYRALVGVFLFGGNDSHNMLIPQETAQYSAYRAIRQGLALPDGNTQLLPIMTRTGVPYALNSGLAAIAPLWATGQLACVANVGMLVAGITLIPEAEPDDGLLDVLVIDPTAPLDWARTTTGILRGKGAEAHPSRTHLRGREVIVSTGHARGRQIDGDPVSSGYGFRVTLREKALAVRVPAS